MLSACVCDPVVSPVPSLVGLVIDGQETLFLQPLENRIECGVLGIGHLFDDLAELVAVGVFLLCDRKYQQDFYVL